jgi:hypothetical protein
MIMSRRMEMGRLYSMEERKEEYVYFDGKTRRKETTRTTST